MSGLNLSAVVTPFVFIVLLLSQFQQNLCLPQWLAPFSLTGLLPLLVVLLPWIHKGSFLAFVVGYVLMALLIFNMLFLFGVAHLPGKSMIALSTSSARAGAILIGFLRAGLVALFQALFTGLGWLMVQAKALLLRFWVTPDNKELETGIA